MKVLHLISGGDKGGAKTHVFTLLDALMEDLEINVICFMEGVFYQEIKDMRIPSMLIKQRYRNDLTIIGKLVKHIRTERYHLIHAHGARANFIATLLRPFIKIPMITTVHSDYRMDFMTSLYKRVIFTEVNSLSLRFLDYYIAVSHNFKEMLVERKFKDERIYTVYNAIDFNKNVSYISKRDFLIRHGFEKLSDENITLVGIIGRFDKVKGHEVFVKAAAKVLEKRKDVYFLLAGEGPEQSNLEALAHHLGIKENIIFLGFINDIYSFINTIDINVLSSYSESFPYVLLEGSLMHKATVSTAVGGIPDLIIDGETGYLAESANDGQMAEAILRFVNSPEKRLELGENLFQYAKSNFSKDSMKNRHIEIYKDVLHRHTQANKSFDVMLSGYYGSNNSGDDAILGAIINSLRKERKDISILVLSKTPKEASALHNVFSIKRSNFYLIIKYMKHTRLFLNGGGNLIQDITSTRSLVYYTALMHLAKRFGLHVMLYANGIGPIIRKHNMKIARSALELCDCITLRESESFDELDRLGVEKKDAVLSSDPALVIEPASQTRLDEILQAERIHKTKKYFTISVRPWKYNDLNFVAKISEVINIISNQYDLIPLFVPMQYSLDVTISKEIIAKLTVDYVLLSKEYNVQELMSVIATTEIVIAMRLHTLIYAASVDVPVIGIVYNPKVKSFLEYIGQKSYVDGNDIDNKKLLAITDDIFAHYDDVKQAIHLESQKLKALSNQDAKLAIGLVE